MSNIVFFIQNFSRSAGSERVTSIIANELAENGHSIRIVSICGDNTCFYELNRSIKLFTLIETSEIDNRKKFLRVIKLLDKFYKNNKTDIVIDVFPALSIYTLILKLKYHFKNISWEHFNYRVNLGMNKIGRMLAVNFSNQIITLTDTDRKYYVEANPRHKAKIDYIYNPSPFQNPDVSDTKHNYIMSVGRLTYQKGFDRLLKMWKMIEDKCEYELFIFGDGEDRDKLQNQIEVLGIKKAKLMGAVPNIGDYYRKAKLYVSTARFEGLPMTMIEAQSFGVPIVSFDYDTGPKEIVNDGIDGVIIKKSSDDIMIREMALKILELTNNDKLQIKLSTSTLESRKRFETDEILLKWLRVINRLQEKD